MNEKIVIKNFGGVKELEAIIKQLNIFIGPQAAGKSVTVKLIFFFKDLCTEIINYIINQKNIDDIKNDQLPKFLKFFPKENWLDKSSFEIRYELTTKLYLKIFSNLESNQIQIEFSPDFIGLYTNLEKTYIQILTKNNSSDSNKILLGKGTKNSSIENKRELIESIPKNIRHILLCTNIFIPAGRSFFANLQSNIFSFIKDNRTIDPFLIEFGSTYERYKSFYNSFLSNSYNKKIPSKNTQRIFELLNASYINEDNTDYLLHHDNRKVNLASASSGQQEAFPLLIILYVLFAEISAFKHSTINLFIEEPEAHLYPTTQNEITKLLVHFCNVNKNTTRLFITTHSPYVLSSFNNSFLAGKIAANEHNKKSLDKIIPKEEQISIVKASVYLLHSCFGKDIVDQELQLIDASELDAISDIINMQFSQLLDVEFGNNI